MEEAAVATAGAEGAAVADAVAGWVVPSDDGGSSWGRVVRELMKAMEK